MGRKAVLLVLCCALILVVALPICLGQLFPCGYGDIVSAYADENGLPPSLVYAVIWCESRFDPKAHSSADACGLMQLRPATFRELCEELGLTPGEDIFSPDANIRCGTRYLGKLLTLFPEKTTALAAYNAGIGNVTAWLEDPRYSDDGKTLHTIPFPETRSYVNKVLLAQKLYEKLYPQEGDS